MYPTTAELVALADDASLSAATPGQQDTYRLLAIRSLEAYAGQSFTEHDGDLLASGTGNPVMFLPRRVIELTAIRNAGSISAASVTIGPDRDRISLSSYARNYYERALNDLDGFRPWFPRGDDNVLLTGRWGWETLPDGVAEVLAQDMAEQSRTADAPLSASVDQFRALGLTSISQGNLAMSFGLRRGGLSATTASLLPPELIWTGSGSGAYGIGAQI